MIARLVESREIAPLVRHFVFEAPEVERFRFIPGQFVSLSEMIGGKEITRAYSIASPPDGNRFDLCLNLVEDGMFSPQLFQMQPGDDVKTSAPLGFFTLRDSGRDAMFVATGTGIAPFRSIVHAQVQRKPAREMTLVFGVRL